MPRIHLSDRRLEGAMPQTRVFRPEYAETIGQGVGALGRQLTRDFNNAIGTLNHIKERDAEIAATEWETAMMRGLNGYVTTGPDGSEQRVPGFGQKTWADYPQDGSQSPITDLERVEREFRSSATYKGMDAITRTKFERRIQLGRQRYLQKANELYDRNRIARDEFYDRKADALDDEKLALAMYGDDDSFEAMNREVATNKTDRRYRRLDRTNPQVQAAYERDLAAETRKAALGRVVSLGQQAAVGETKIVGGRLVSQSDELDRADKYLDSLVQRGFVTKQEASAAGYKLVQSRAQLDNRIRGEIRNFSANALAKGDLEEISAAHVAMGGLASLFAKGSENQTAALVELRRLDAEADREAERRIENDLLSGKRLTMGDGKTLIYNPENEVDRRFIRLYPAVKAKVDEMRRKGEERMMRENNDSVLYEELILDYEIQSGTLSADALARRKRDICDRVQAMAEGRLMKPKDAIAFGRRWDARNAADESAAAVEFDRAFGLSLKDFVDEKGAISAEVTDAGYRKVVNSGQQAVFPGTDESVSLGEYLKMRASFLERLRALPSNADRRQETERLIGEFRGGWYSRQAKADIEALSRTMNDIHLGIEAEYEAERLRAAAEEQRRNMPVVDRRHPANAEPKPDPLEFYRQANPLDPTIKYR